MKKIFALIFGASIGLCTQANSAAAQADPHAYFDALRARADHFKSYSLRSSAQLARPLDGGYANGNSDPLVVTYEPGSDPDPERQDAAKAVIPTWRESENIFKNAVGLNDAQIQMSDSAGDVTKVNTGFNAVGKQLKVGSEIMVLAEWPRPCPTTNPGCAALDRTTGVITVKRAQYGTTAGSYAAGTAPLVGGNSLGNQVRVPLGTSDGNTYLVTWDSYHTQSYLKTGLRNHKAFQFDNKGIWLEQQTRFNGDGVPCFDREVHVASVSLRSYLKLGGPATWTPETSTFLGPIVTKNSPVLPMTGDFCIHPSRWTRWWVLVEQRANDYDYVSMWMADEVQSPIQLYNRIPVSLRSTSTPPNSIEKFWIELNTSMSELPEERVLNQRDLVSYHRNIVALINPPADITPFLIRPSQAVGSLPTPRFGPPRNFRSAGS